MKKSLPVVDVVKDGIEVLKLNKVQMSHIAHDPKATVWAFGILGLPFVVNILLAMFQETTFMYLQVKFLLIPLVTMVGCIFLMSFVAQKVFHAKGDHMAFFRVIAYAGIVTWLSVIPFVLSLFGLGDVFRLFNLVNLVAGVWMLVVTYTFLIDYYKLNQQNAIITIVLGVVGASILQSVLGRALIGPFYKLMYL